MVASVLGFGGSEIGYQGVSGRTVGRLLGGALDAGLNVIDTAECYDESEKLIGNAIGSRRREFYLFTKCGHAGGWARADWRRAPLLASVQKSLKRLATDYVDLIQLHSCSLETLRKGEVMQALEEARALHAGRHAVEAQRGRAAIDVGGRRHGSAVGDRLVVGDRDRRRAAADECGNKAAANGFNLWQLGQDGLSKPCRSGQN